MSSTLSGADVERLLNDRSSDARAQTAEKVAREFANASLSDGARREAEQIVRALLQDVELQVRASLSTNLRFCEAIPHDVALTLASDIDSVALPMLQDSPALSDADLIAIIAEAGETKQAAIARRPTVSADVADALVATDSEEVVATLVGNDGADIGDATYSRILDTFADSERVTTPLVHRQQIPVAIAERLVAMVSEQLGDYLVARHELPADMASDLILKSRERTTLQLSGADNVSDLVRSLAANGRLTPSIVLRALCMGDMPFFEWSLAVLAKVPITSTRTLIYDRGALGLRAIWEHCGFPSEMLKVAEMAVEVASETDYDGEEGDRERYVRRMVERVLTHFEDPAELFDADSLDYLVDKVTAAYQPAAT